MAGPTTVSTSPLLTAKVLPEAVVRSLIVAFIFSVTVDTPSTMSTLYVAPEGTPLLGTTPADQSVATLQFPEDPSDQVSVVWACAGRFDNSASTETDEEMAIRALSPNTRSVFIACP